MCPAYYLLLLCARGVFSGLLSLYGVGPANTDARALWGFALLRTLFVIVGAALVVYLFGCYIDVPPVRAGLQPDTARRALVAHSVP